MQHRIGIVGAGRLGSVLARAVARIAGADPIVWSRADRHAPSLAEMLGSVDIVILCVADDASADVVNQLVSERGSFQGLVVSASAASSIDLLEPLRAVGCSTARMHPLAAITSGSRPCDLIGVRAAITVSDGSDVGRVHSLARELGMLPFDLQDADHLRWHAAASIAASHVAASLGSALEIARDIGLDEHELRQAFAALACGAIAGVATHGAVDALTGPIARSDAETLERHQVMVAGRSTASVLSQWRATSRVIIEQLADAERIDAEAACQMEDVIRCDQS